MISVSVSGRQASRALCWSAILRVGLSAASAPCPEPFETRERDDKDGKIQPEATEPRPLDPHETTPPALNSRRQQGPLGRGFGAKKSHSKSTFLDKKNIFLYASKPLYSSIKGYFAISFSIGGAVEIEKKNGNSNGKHVAIPAQRSRGRPKSVEPGTTKVHVSLPENLTQRLDSIKKVTCASSLTEVIRSALLLYAYAVEEHQAGGRVYTKRPNEEIERELALFLPLTPESTN
jgi:hypothetical protein